VVYVRVACVCGVACGVWRVVCGAWCVAGGGVVGGVCGWW